MFYIKKPKPPIQNLYKTYTEVEERRYSAQTINIGFKGLFALIALFCAFTALSACPMVLRLNECYWDGAGDTWTCSECGESNYDWQNSCGNCGGS